MPWKGERIVIVGYTPGLLAAVPRVDREMLWDLQFPLPLEEDDPTPEIYINALSVSVVKPKQTIEEEIVPVRGGGWQEVIETSDGDYLFKCDWSISRRSSTSLSMMSVSGASTDPAQCGLRSEDWSDWEMLLVLEEDQGHHQTAMLPGDIGQSPAVRKAEIAYTEGVEDILANLTTPLSVVYTVNPREVAPVFEKWIPSLQKEVSTLDHAVDKVLCDDQDVRDNLASGKGQLIPMKVVYTIKPEEEKP